MTLVTRRRSIDENFSLNWIQPHEGPRFEAGDHVSKIVVSNDDLQDVTRLLNDTNVEFEIHSDLQEKISRSINFNKARDLTGTPCINVLVNAMRSRPDQ